MGVVVKDFLTVQGYSARHSPSPSQTYCFGLETCKAVLRIRDVYPWSQIRIFPHPGSRISDPGSRISDPGSRIPDPTKKEEVKCFLKNLFNFFLRSTNLVHTTFMCTAFVRMTFVSTTFVSTTFVSTTFVSTTFVSTTFVIQASKCDRRDYDLREYNLCEYDQRNMLDWSSCCVWRTILVLLKNPWVVVYT